MVVVVFGRNVNDAINKNGGVGTKLVVVMMQTVVTMAVKLFLRRW